MIQLTFHNPNRRYNFGLTCVDSEGSTTRHLFGVNSFDPEETFDTLVRTQLDWGRGRGRIRFEA